MEYRLDKNTLLDTLGQWNGFLRRRVHLIACGGTALTLMDVKPSTKDCDIQLLEKHARELASYDVGEVRIMGQIDRFMEILREEKLYG